MGSFNVEVEIGDPSGTRFESVEALVDTGAAYTCIPSDVLTRLGVRPTDRRTFELADGRMTSYGFAFATIRLQGKVQPTPVIFGDEGSGALLGVVTLEEFSLGIDPMNQQLIEVALNLKGVRLLDE
ncbi:MAG TPA: clan AA aspartic protease [Dehalococcoidia bacterium]